MCPSSSLIRGSILQCENIHCGFLFQMMNSNPMVQQMMNSNPQMRQMLQNPEFLRRFTDPQTINAVLQMQQAMSQLQNAFGGASYVLVHVVCVCVCEREMYEG